VSVTAKTNNFDFPGELATFCERNATNEPLTVEDTTARLWSWCPAMLPRARRAAGGDVYGAASRKATQRRFIPCGASCTAFAAAGRRFYSPMLSPSLKDYEHLIVVLASGGSTPAAYTHFDRLLSVKMPQVEATESNPLRYYHVFRPSSIRLRRCQAIRWRGRRSRMSSGTISIPRA